MAKKKGPIHRKQGSQKPNPNTPGNPKKYMGKSEWEQYNEPQNAKKSMVNPEGFKSIGIGETLTELVDQEMSETFGGTQGDLGMMTPMSGSDGKFAIPDAPILTDPQSFERIRGAKAPTKKVKKTVKKSYQDKNFEKELNEFRLDELFGGGKLPYEYDPNGFTEIDVNDEVSVVVGLEPITNYIPDAEPGVNVGMVTATADGGFHLGLERANMGLDNKSTLALFNSVIEVVQRLVKDNNPDRVYFIAVGPMKGIYPRLLKRFVPGNEWGVTRGEANIMGYDVDIYKVERKDAVQEMVRVPIFTLISGEYEVLDCEKKMGYARVVDGVIHELVCSDSTEESYRGEVLTNLLKTIIGEADLQNSPLSLQLADKDDEDMKRFMERFGFKHVGHGVMQRTAGAVSPPSVQYTDGMDGESRS